MNIQKRIEQKANEGEYREGESCSFYMNEIDAFQEGAHFGFQLCIEIIRDIPTMKNTRPNYHTELADWLEKMKEQGEG